MEDYNDIKDMMKPRRDFAASDELRNRIDSVLDSYIAKKKSPRWIWSLGATCVAAAVLILILVPSGISAKEILAETLNTLLDTDGIKMTVEVRTRPMENFRYINIDEDFVEHNISISKSDSTISWCIDKGGRTAMGNDKVVYNWIKQLNIGWRTNGLDPNELLGEMAILLRPEKIIEYELHNCINNSESQYNLEKKGGEIILTIHSQPQGDFRNPYMLNTSIIESENDRRYVIDAATKHLKSASVSIINGKKEIEVLKITDIGYGQTHTNLKTLPSGVRFIDMPGNSLQGLTGLTATEAASAFLNALETWNESILDIVVDENFKNGIYKQELKGSVLVAVGKSFTSGIEGAIYVPYVLRLPDGNQKQHNLVLQKSSQGGWIVIGGL